MVVALPPRATMMAVIMALFPPGNREEAGSSERRRRERKRRKGIPTSISSENKIGVGREGDVQFSVTHEVVELYSVNNTSFSHFLEQEKQAETTHVHLLKAGLDQRDDSPDR